MNNARRPHCFYLALAIVLLAGCAGGAAPAKEPARLDLIVTAASDVNADSRGRAAPVRVRIYELKSETSFEAADFFTLQGGDKAVLQDDLLVKTEYLMRPGDTQRIRRKSNAETTVIGVLASYRDLPGTQWRAVHKLEDAPEASWWRVAVPSNKARLAITLEAEGVRIQAGE